MEFVNSDGGLGGAGKLPPGTNSSAIWFSSRWWANIKAEMSARPATQKSYLRELSAISVSYEAEVMIEGPGEFVYRKPRGT